MARRELIGVVLRDKMDKGIVVGVERRVRHKAYGKIQRLTSTFMAHDEETPRRSVTGSSWSSLGH